MRMLITGGTGIIGHNLCRGLEGVGCQQLGAPVAVGSGFRYLEPKEALSS
jgi:nucleoside-diphosphate-sugar epimerase